MSLKEISNNDLKKQLENLILQTSIKLPEDIRCFLVDKTDSNLSNMILENNKIASTQVLPLCQDTGFSIFYVEKGNIVLDNKQTITEVINESVSKVYSKGILRPSILNTALRGKNTNNNTPAFVHICERGDNKLIINFLAKGGGSENAGAVKMFTPAEDINEIIKFVVEIVKANGTNSCPPLIIGIGIGGTMDHASWLSKKALFKKIGERNTNSLYSEMENKILYEVNSLNIGVMGMGEGITAIDVFIEASARHIATLPVAVSLLCHSARRGSIEL